jgi:transposase
MARRPIPMIELDELMYRWQQGHTISQLSRSLGQSRQTVRKYLRRAEKHGATRDGDQAQRTRVLAAMRAAGVKPAVQTSPSHRRLAPYQEQIRAWLGEPDMTMKQIWRLLRERGVKLSYPSVKRFVHSTLAPLTPRVTVRIETPPGQQAQVDFGSARVRFGEKVRQLWVFVLTLSFSRHRFVRFVERQDLPNWLDCHVRAFEFFSGVPKTVLLDNLKAGVVRPDLYDPTINRAYAELERPSQAAPP